MWRRGHATAQLVLVAQFGDFKSRDGLAHTPQVDSAAHVDLDAVELLGRICLVAKHSSRRRYLSAMARRRTTVRNRFERGGGRFLRS